jgi:pimeloyl-ACP methyl ester carboxylesterase
MVARLHHDFVAGDAPRAWALFTHGIYGSGGNWRAIARQVVARRPEWGVVLVDLRHHGRSEPGDPPHTVAACAGDMVALADELSGAGKIVRATLGHSFGGKVMLSARPHLEPAQTWVLDSTPSARSGEWDAPGNSVREV